MPDAAGDHDHRHVAAAVDGAASQVAAAAAGGVGGRRGQDRGVGPGPDVGRPERARSSKPPSSQVMKIAEWFVQARLWVMAPTQVRKKVSPSLYSAAWLASVGELGRGRRSRRRACHCRCSG